MNKVLIYTASGKMFNLANPEPSQIDINDIAHSLSMQCRFAGHTPRFYSVAEHSLLVSDLLPDELKLWGLLHDATEAYISDISSPVKNLIPEITHLEMIIMEAIAIKFNLPFESFTEPAEVKNADLKILENEINYFFEHKHNLTTTSDPFLKYYFTPKQFFLKRFNELTNR